MSVRQDKVQIQVEFITDQSKQLAKTIVDTKQLNQNLSTATKELEKYRKEVAAAGADEAKRAVALEKVAAAEKKVATAANEIAVAGSKVEKLDLTKVAPAQLTERARQLAAAMKLIPQSAPAYAKLVEELKAVNAQLGNIRNSTRAASAAPGDEGGGFLGNILKVGGKAAAVLGGITAAYELLKRAITGASELEQLTISFETFLGSASKAKEVIADLKAFEVKTPFEAEQVNSAGRALLAFGFSTEELIPTLTAVGDVAAGTGKDFNELALIYGKAKAQGLLQGEELNQLAEAGIPIYKELAKVLNVDQSEIRKLGEQGRIQFGDLEKVFQNLTSEGGRFAGLMEKQSQSVGGLYSTLKSQFDNLLAGIGTQLLPAIKDLLQAFVGIGNYLGPVLIPVFDQLGKSIQGLILLSKDLISLNSLTSGADVKSVVDSFLTKYNSAYRQIKEKKKQIREEENAREKAEQARDDRQLSPEEIEALNEREAEKARLKADRDKKAAEETAKRVEAAFQKALAQQQDQTAKEELLLENRRINGLINEEAYFAEQTDITRRGLEEQLRVYALFHRDQQQGALEARNKLDEINAGYNDRIIQNEVQVLQNALTSELNLQQRTVELKQAARDEDLALLRKHGEDVLAEDKKLKEERLKEAEDLEKRKQDVQRQAFAATADGFALVADLYAQDESRRKQNASIIKAFQKAEIITNSIAEVQAIYRNAQTSIQGKVLGPIAAYSLATVQAAISAGRATLAINNIEKQKFARGVLRGFGVAKSGIFGGNSHDAGGTTGVFSDGTRVEVEKDELWAVVNKRNTPVLSMLSGVNALGGNGVPYFRDGGVMKFAGGGLPSINTTPSATTFSTGGDGSSSNAAAIERAALLLLSAAQQFPREVSARVAYLDVEEKGNTLNAIRDEASV